MVDQEMRDGFIPSGIHIIYHRERGVEKRLGE